MYYDVHVHHSTMQLVSFALLSMARFRIANVYCIAGNFYWTIFLLQKCLLT